MKKKTERTGSLLSIGASQSAVKEARGAINDILRAPHVDSNVKTEALRVLGTLCGVGPMSINNCNFQG